jgi:uncharacterized protein Yka (UPF0111/DUF47 family)
LPKFSFLPSQSKFFELFERASANLLEGARLLQDLLDDYTDVERKVAQITETEHTGDNIVHQAAFTFGTAVAKTVGSGLVDVRQSGH